MLKVLENGTRLEKPDNAACAPEMYVFFSFFHCDLGHAILLMT